MPLNEWYALLIKICLYLLAGGMSVCPWPEPGHFVPWLQPGRTLYQATSRPYKICYNSAGLLNTIAIYWYLIFFNKTLNTHLQEREWVVWRQQQSKHWKVGWRWVGQRKLIKTLCSRKSQFKISSQGENIRWKMVSKELEKTWLGVGVKVKGKNTCKILDKQKL